MKKMLILILCIIFLTACSYHDAECEFCGESVYSEHAKCIDDRICCDNCYDNAGICSYCKKKYINAWHEGSEYCDACIENMNVLYCSICETFKPNDEVLVEPQINDLLFIDNVCNECFYNVEIPKYCGTDFYSTWENLLDDNGGELVWSTLTDIQRELVKYPYFDSEKVYFVPGGYAFHSVDWCYTLSNSDTIYYCTCDTAYDFGLDPCSKCVYFED